MVVNLHPSFAIHPGPWIRTELVEAHALSVTLAAGKLGVTRQALSNLLNGKAAVSAEMAVRLEKGFGVRADTLLRMQAQHDLAMVRAREDGLVVEPVRAA